VPDQNFHPDQRLDDARASLLSGDRVATETVIDDAFSATPLDPEHISAVIAMLRDHDEFEWAIAVADQAAAHGVDLLDEVSANKIASEFRDAGRSSSAFESGEDVTFSRIGFIERDGPSRVRPWDRSFARSATFGSDAVAIKRMFSTVRFRWEDVEEVYLVRSESHTAYGYSRVPYIRQVLRFELKRGTVIQLDVSSVRREFSQPSAIREIVASRRSVEVPPVVPWSKRDQLTQWAKNSLFLLALITIAVFADLRA
jgi:hypothetical protein